MIFEKVANEKYSIRKVFRWMKEDLKFITKNNKPLTLSNIQLLLRNNFYMGMIEYPRGSGKWYPGKHEPLITKELFLKVQMQLDSNKSDVVRVDREFAFTKLMKCGMCGSGICADEKFKKLKNGNINRHCYYGCTKSRDKNCKCGYISEEELINQFVELIDTIDINEIGIKEKIKAEVERIKKFQRVIMGTKEKIEVKDVDIRNYAKYVLREASNLEKRELLGCLKNKISLANKKINIFIHTI